MLLLLAAVTAPDSVMSKPSFVRTFVAEQLKVRRRRRGSGCLPCRGRGAFLFLTAPPSRLSCSQQSLLASVENTRAHRWDDAVILWSLQALAHGTAATWTSLSQGFAPQPTAVPGAAAAAQPGLSEQRGLFLPSLRHLRRLSARATVRPSGLDQHAMENTAQLVDLGRCTGVGYLSFDEMQLKSGLVWSKSGDALVGFVDEAVKLGAAAFADQAFAGAL